MTNIDRNSTRTNYIVVASSEDDDSNEFDTMDSIVHIPHRDRRTISTSKTVAAGDYDALKPRKKRTRTRRKQQEYQTSSTPYLFDIPPVDPCEQRCVPFSIKFSMSMLATITMVFLAAAVRNEYFPTSNFEFPLAHDSSYPVNGDEYTSFTFDDLLPATNLTSDVSDTTSKLRPICADYPHDFPHVLPGIKQGAFLVPLVGVIYFLCALGHLQMSYLDPWARWLSDNRSWSTRQGEALTLNIVGILVQIMMHLFGMLFTHRDLGLGVVIGAIGSNLFLITTGMIYALTTVAPIGFTLFWFRASRDSFAFCLSILLVVSVTIATTEITYAHAVAVLVSAPLYALLWHKSAGVYQWLSHGINRSTIILNSTDPELNQSIGLIDFLEGTLFSVIINLLICMSVVCVIWDEMTGPSWLVTVNYFFSAIFILECVIKHFAYGLFGYWKEPLNAFDGVLVTLILFEFIFSSGNIAGSVRVVRLFRFLRALRGMRAIRVTRGISFKNGTFHFTKHSSRKSKAQQQAQAAANGATGSGNESGNELSKLSKLSLHGPQSLGSSTALGEEHAFQNPVVQARLDHIEEKVKREEEALAAAAAGATLQPSEQQQRSRAPSRESISRNDGGGGRISRAESFSQVYPFSTFQSAEDRKFSAIVSLPGGMTGMTGAGLGVTAPSGGLPVNRSMSFSAFPMPHGGVGGGVLGLGGGANSSMGSGGGVNKQPQIRRSFSGLGPRHKRSSSERDGNSRRDSIIAEEPEFDPSLASRSVTVRDDSALTRVSTTGSSLGRVFHTTSLFDESGISRVNTFGSPPGAARTFRQGSLGGSFGFTGGPGVSQSLTMLSPILASPADVGSTGGMEDGASEEAHEYPDLNSPGTRRKLNLDDAIDSNDATIKEENSEQRRENSMSASQSQGGSITGGGGSGAGGSGGILTPQSGFGSTGVATGGSAPRPLGLRTFSFNSSSIKPGGNVAPGLTTPVSLFQPVSSDQQSPLAPGDGIVGASYGFTAFGSAGVDPTGSSSSSGVVFVPAPPPTARIPGRGPISIVAPSPAPSPPLPVVSQAFIPISSDTPQDSGLQVVALPARASPVAIRPIASPIGILSPSFNGNDVLSPSGATADIEASSSPLAAAGMETPVKTAGAGAGVRITVVRRNHAHSEGETARGDSGTAAAADDVPPTHLRTSSVIAPSGRLKKQLIIHTPRRPTTSSEGTFRNGGTSSSDGRDLSILTRVRTARTEAAIAAATLIRGVGKDGSDDEDSGEKANTDSKWTAPQPGSRLLLQNRLHHVAHEASDQALLAEAKGETKTEDATSASTLAVTTTVSDDVSILSPTATFRDSPTFVSAVPRRLNGAPLPLLHIPSPIGSKQHERNLGGHAPEILSLSALSGDGSLTVQPFSAPVPITPNGGRDSPQTNAPQSARRFAPPTPLGGAHSTNLYMAALGLRPSVLATNTQTALPSPFAHEPMSAPTHGPPSARRASVSRTTTFSPAHRGPGKGYKGSAKKAAKLLGVSELNPQAGTPNEMQRSSTHHHQHHHHHGHHGHSSRQRRDSDDEDEPSRTMHSDLRKTRRPSILRKTTMAPAPFHVPSNSNLTAGAVQDHDSQVADAPRSMTGTGALDEPDEYSRSHRSDSEYSYSGSDYSGSSEYSNAPSDSGWDSDATSSDEDDDPSKVVRRRKHIRAWSVVPKQYFHWRPTIAITCLTIMSGIILISLVLNIQALFHGTESVAAFPVNSTDSSMVANSFEGKFLGSHDIIDPQVRIQV